MASKQFSRFSIRSDILEIWSVSLFNSQATDWSSLLDILTVGLFLGGDTGSADSARFTPLLLRVASVDGGDLVCLLPLRAPFFAFAGVILRLPWD